MTSVGFADTINPLAGFEVAHGYKVGGGAYFTETEEAFPLVNVTDGCSVSYRYIDFSGQKEWTLELEGTFFESGETVVYINDREVAGLKFAKGDTKLASTLQLKACTESDKEKADLRMEFRGETSEVLLQLDKIRFS